jgi:hypothetical protein
LASATIIAFLYQIKKSLNWSTDTSWLSEVENRSILITELTEITGRVSAVDSIFRLVTLVASSSNNKQSEDNRKELHFAIMIVL